MSPTHTKREKKPVMFALQHLDLDNWILSDLKGQITFLNKGPILGWVTRKFINLRWRFGKKVKTQLYSDLTAYELLPNKPKTR